MRRGLVELTPRSRPRPHALGALVGVGCFAVACGTDVAQTAAMGQVAPLDCTFAGALVLPQDDVFGDGSEATSPLVSSSYASGEGPGLYVTARDAFRIYLNGALVVESTEPRSPAFVPLSLLPGDNALSVVVAAKRGTPVAALQLDDLDRSYVSNGTWKASTEPDGDFASADYDDSAWTDATDYGRYGVLPDCEPEDGFVSPSDAHWIGPAEGTGTVVVLRKVVRLRALGYGAESTGGGSTEPTVVDSWEELEELASEPDEPAVILLPEGVHDFRDAPRDQEVCPAVCTNDASKTTYTVLTSSQTCAKPLITKSRTDRRLALGSNKTIVGLGRGAQLRGVTVDLGSNHDLIVRNVAVTDVNHDLIAAGDAFAMDDPRDVWLDHCTVKAVSDGYTLTGAAMNATFSWLHYDGVRPSACNLQHTQAMQFDDAVVTLHHSFFDQVQSHSPRVDNGAARAHIFNNLFRDNQGYAVGSTCGAQVLLEANTFQRVATPTARSTCADDTTYGLIDAPEGSNYYGDDVGDHHGPDLSEPHDAVFKPPYSYTLELPQDDWLTVFSRAGTGGPWALPLELD